MDVLVRPEQSSSEGFVNVVAFALLVFQAQTQLCVSADRQQCIHTRRLPGSTDVQCKSHNTTLFFYFQIWSFLIDLLSEAASTTKDEEWDLFWHLVHRTHQKRMHINACGTTFTTACVHVGGCAHIHTCACACAQYSTICSPTTFRQVTYLGQKYTCVCKKCFFGLKKWIFVIENGTAQQNFGGKNRQVWKDHSTPRKLARRHGGHGYLSLG